MSSSLSLRLKLAALLLVALATLVLLVLGLQPPINQARLQWSPQERAMLNSLRLPKRLQPRDPSNRFLDSPAAAQLGHQLFFDKRLSGAKDMACATCHIPERYFSDGRPLPIVANNTSLSELPTRHTPTVVGAALHRWQFWDGRADSLWAQALGPLENPLEHNSDRLAIVRYVLNEYRLSYLQVFPNSEVTLPKLERLPEHGSPLSPIAEYQTNWQQLSSEQRSEINHVFANIGKALAAYQAKLLPDDSRFDRFVDGLNLPTDNRPQSYLDQHEQAGLKLFISEQAGCIQCHNGPLFSNSDFQATLSSADITPEREGRIAGIALAHADPFNCRGIYSDAPNSCGELDFAKVDGIELQAAFKVPGLRNVAKTAPYMHDGGFASLSEVLHYYNQAPTHGFSHNELQPLRLLPYQLKQLESFLVALNSELITDAYWLTPLLPLRKEITHEHS